MDELAGKRASLMASVALLAFTALTSVALVGWFQQEPEELWTYKSIVALVAALGAVTMSALVWQTPTRRYVHIGAAIMIVSLARIGPPNEWTSKSLVLVAVTFALVLPLIHASSVLKSVE